MAVGLFAAFKALPWPELLTLAPTVVQSARKLWNSARADESKNSVPSANGTLGNTESRLRTLEARVAEIASEAVSSAELIKSLAEQNSQLVQAVEILRVRTRGLLWATATAWLMTLALLLTVVILR